MKILAVDISTKTVSAALLDNGKIKARTHKLSSKNKGSMLIPVIKKLLEKSNCSIKKIDIFAVGTGPGSFTGLRISLAAMRSLAIALEKPIIGVSSFDVIAFNAVQYTINNTQYINICVSFDARQNKVYARFYRYNKYKMKPVSGFMLDSAENILKAIKNPTIIIGDAVAIYKDKIINISRDIKFISEERLWYPKAEILAKIALARYNKGELDNPFKLLPLYIYPKECQVRKVKN